MVKKLASKEKYHQQFEKEFKKIKINLNPNQKSTNENFDEEAQKDFLKGARIAYETIITDFSDGDNKLNS